MANYFDEAVTIFKKIIINQFKESFRLIKVKVSLGDSPFMSPIVKHLCKIRNRRLTKGACSIEQLERINKLIKEN